MSAIKKKIRLGSPCPVARTLDVIGEKWTILILRDFFKYGPRKYQDLSCSLKGISPNLLSARLKILVEHEILNTQIYSEHPPRFEYILTDRGKSLGPILKDLKSWGEKFTVWDK